jgi:hypothetical protein
MERQVVTPDKDSDTWPTHFGKSLRVKSPPLPGFVGELTHEG